MQIPTDDELDLVVIAIQALAPHQPDTTTHDQHAVDGGREILQDFLRNLIQDTPRTMTYSFFRLGSYIYWHYDPETVKRAHCQSLLFFPDSGPIETSEIHPSRLTAQGVSQAWQLSNAT
jgi:hypothetical protein